MIATSRFSAAPAIMAIIMPNCGSSGAIKGVSSKMVSAVDMNIPAMNSTRFKSSRMTNGSSVSPNRRVVTVSGTRVRVSALL